MLLVCGSEQGAPVVGAETVPRILLILADAALTLPLSARLYQCPHHDCVLLPLVTSDSRIGLSLFKAWLQLLRRVVPIFPGKQDTIRFDSKAPPS